MKFKQCFCRCAPMLLGALLITSCETGKETKTPEQKAAEQKAAAERKAAEKAIEKTTDALSEVEKSVNDWGRIAISDLLLVENTGQFKVTYDEDPTNYVQAARQNVNGAARSSLATTLYLGSALNAQLSSPISAGSAPTSTTNGAADLALPNQAQQAMSNFTPVQTLAGIIPTSDERQAVQKGINDKIAESLLKFMANPKVGTNSQKIIFGVMQVTCQPGKNTRSDYIADVNISLKYATGATNAMDTNGSITKPSNVKYYYKTEGNQPSVVAVLPLVDNQNVQLENSNRKQVELAANLAAIFAAKGMAAQAKILADYVTKQESDINTRTPIPVATSYTDGSTFGFQIYPFFQGVKNPDKSFSGPGEVLHPITFPAVVAILIDSNDINKPQKPNFVPQMIVVTKGSFSDANASLLETIKNSKMEYDFNFAQTINVFLKKNIELYEGTASIVLTNFDVIKKRGFGTFNVPSLATKFVVSDIHNAEAFRRRLHDHHADKNLVENTIYTNLDSDAKDYVDGRASAINAATWPEELVKALNAVIKECGANSFMSRRPSSEPFLLVDVIKSQLLPQEAISLESQQRYSAASSAYIQAAKSYLKESDAFYTNEFNELVNSLDEAKPAIDCATESIVKAVNNEVASIHSQDTNVTRVQELNAVVVALKQDGDAAKKALDQAIAAAKNALEKAIAAAKKETLAAEMSTSVPDDAVSVAKAFDEAVLFREKFDVASTVATQMTDEAGKKLNEVIKTATNSAPEKAVAAARNALKNAVTAVLEKAQAAKSSITNAQAAAFKVMATYPGPNDLIVLNRLLIEDAFSQELIPTTSTSGAGTFELLMPKYNSLSGVGISLTFMTLSSGYYDAFPNDKRMVSCGPMSTSSPSHQSIPAQNDMVFTWNMLQTELRTSWICTGNRRILSPIGKFWRGNKLSRLWQKKDLTMEDRMKRAENIDNAYVAITNLQKQISSGTNTDLFYRYEQLQIALDSFETIALNTTRLTPLPPSLLSKPNDSKSNDSKAPKILSIFPSFVWRNTNTIYDLLLTNFDQIYHVNVAGKHFDYSNGAISNITTDMGKVIQVTLPPLFCSATNSTNTLEFVVVGNEGLASKILPVTLQDKPAEQREEATSKITRDGNGKLTGFTVIRSGNDTNVIPVLEAVKEILMKSELSTNTTINKF